MAITNFWDLPYGVSIIVDEDQLIDIEFWCTQNIKGKWNWETDCDKTHFRFELIEDATHFKLTK
jgi:hypothetical protein